MKMLFTTYIFNSLKRILLDRLCEHILCARQSSSLSFLFNNNINYWIATSRCSSRRRSNSFLKSLNTPKEQNHKSGFALIVTMIMISLIASITVFIARKSTLFAPYAKIAIHQQKARQLALGGVQLAISKLASITKPEKQTTTDQGQQRPQKMDDTYLAQQLLTHLVPIINQSQTIPLKKAFDGIDGKIEFCITSEHGKININQLYDFEKHRFIDEHEKATDDEKKKGARQLIKNVFEQVQKAMGATNLFESFEKFIKQRQYKLNDVTELLAAPGFDIFKNYLFYVPPTLMKDSEKAWRPIFLTDLFTLESGKKQIEPWLLSDSLRGGFGFSRVAQESQEKKESTHKMIQEALKKFSLSTDWKKDWDKMLAPSLKKEYGSLSPSITSHLSTKFESTIFSVVSYGTFANVTQRLYALLERSVQKAKDDVVIHVKIKKIYWL